MGIELTPVGVRVNDCCLLNYDEKEKVDPSEFTLGCKVPDHTGPLGEGWETNHKWDESKDPSRVKHKTLKNGEIDPSDFGIWTDFTNCMSAVMKIIEGAAYYPEASETFRTSPKTGFDGYANVNKPPATDDGTLEVNNSPLPVVVKILPVYKTYFRALKLMKKSWQVLELGSPNFTWPISGSFGKMFHQMRIFQISVFMEAVQDISTIQNWQKNAFNTCQR